MIGFIKAISPCVKSASAKLFLDLHTVLAPSGDERTLDTSAQVERAAHCLCTCALTRVGHEFVLSSAIVVHASELTPQGRTVSARRHAPRELALRRCMRRGGGGQHAARAFALNESVNEASFDICLQPSVK